jgi:spore germination cell wall hydrolase CwlJ-like protein
MTDLEVRAALNDLQAFGLTGYGEVRGESDAGRRAFVSVVVNRVKTGRWGHTFKSVCLWPAQFSCWLAIGGAANYACVMSVARVLVGPDPHILPASLKACLALADLAMAGKLEDTTGGATNYLTELLYANHPPTWALHMKQTARIGGHLFFRD